VESNTIRGMPAPVASQRRRARFRPYDTDTPAADAEPWKFAAGGAAGEERPWYDRPPETEETAAELDDAEPAMC
jgi:hypothetical protein